MAAIGLNVSLNKYLEILKYGKDARMQCYTQPFIISYSYNWETNFIEDHTSKYCLFDYTLNDKVLQIHIVTQTQKSLSVGTSSLVELSQHQH